MDGVFNSIEQFEQVLLKTITRVGEINLGKLMVLVTSEEKDKLKKLYEVDKIGKKIIEIIETNPDKYVFTSKTDQNKNNWFFKIKENDTNQIQEVNEVIPVSNKSKTEKKIEQPNEGIVQEKENTVLREQENNVNNAETITLKPEDDALPDDMDDTNPSLYKDKEIILDEDLKDIVVKDMILINDEFYISKYLVTQELYERVMEENPSHFRDEQESNERQERRPVETVSYLDAIEFCNKLSEKCGFDACYKKGNYIPESNGFRLPTESEWDFVVTAKNTNSLRYAGSDVPDGFAWYKHNAKNKTHAVGKKKPVMINDSDEIFDMSGNVWEWIMPDINTDKALFIGGSFEDSEDYLELRKPMNKRVADKKTKNSTIGFRICVNFLK